MASTLDAHFRKTNIASGNDITFDPDMLKEFGAAFGVEYVFGAEVSEWMEVAIDMNVEGYSHSDVAAAFKIIAVETTSVPDERMRWSSGMTSWARVSPFTV